MLAAGQEIGLPILPDINQPNTDGIGISQSTVDRRGRRASSYAAFLKPVESRSNLTIRHGAEVVRELGQFVEQATRAKAPVTIVIEERRNQWAYAVAASGWPFR